MPYADAVSNGGYALLNAVSSLTAFHPVRCCLLALSSPMLGSDPSVHGQNSCPSRGDHLWPSALVMERCYCRREWWSAMLAIWR